MAQFPCTKCGRLLEPSGEVTVNGAAFPVYQCDNHDCRTTEDFGGELIEVAHTFCVDGAGTPFNPADGPPEAN